MQRGCPLAAQQPVCVCGDVSMSGNFGARAIWKHFGSGVGLFLTEMPEMKMAKKNFRHMSHRVSGDLRGVLDCKSRTPGPGA